jgi:DNA primase
MLPIDEILSRTTLSDRIERDTRVVRRGRQPMAVCPFHDDKGPSMSINDDKGVFFCHGCGAKGNAIQYHAQLRGLSFSEAARDLAHEFGIPLSEDPQQRQRNALKGLLRTAQEAYRTALIGSPSPTVKTFLEKRGLTPEVVSTFGLGLGAPLPIGPSKEGASAGLFSSKGFPYMKDRLTFPIRDERGHVIAFAGRVIEGMTPFENAPKYLNTPETVLFHKGQTLYGLFESRTARERLNTTVVVEGYMDVMAAHKAGLSHTVGVMGTAVTPHVMGLLFAKTDTVVLLLDGDAPGQAAMARAAMAGASVLKDGQTLKFATLPQGCKDPDEVLTQKGPEALHQAVEKAVTLTEYWLTHTFKENPLNTSESRVAAWAHLNAKADTLTQAPALKEALLYEGKAQLQLAAMMAAFEKGGLTVEKAREWENRLRVFSDASEGLNAEKQPTPAATRPTPRRVAP